MTDAELVSMALGEDINDVETTEADMALAFETLMSRHYDSVARVAYAALGSASELEDVLQSSFLATFRSLRSLEDRSKFKYWARAIAANQARDLVRRRIYFGIPDSLDELITLPEQPDDIVEASWQLEELGKHLPERYMKVLYLRYYVGYTVNEVSEILGIDAGLVKWRASRARRLASMALRGAEPSPDDQKQRFTGFSNLANKEVNQSGQIGSSSGHSPSPPLRGNTSELY